MGIFISMHILSFVLKTNKAIRNGTGIYFCMEEKERKLLQMQKAESKYQNKSYSFSEVT